MTGTSYDEIAYPGLPYRQTHPTRLAVAAHLLGLPYAPPERCRYLEIGCGDGANLIPMAVAAPHAVFHGFDLAESPIARGQALIDRLGLTNVRLEARDILAARPDALPYDYITAHGVYSWVPEPVREGVMRLMGEALAPHGVAFVSYNALPGCRLRQIMREMLLYRLEGIEGPDARIVAARGLLELFAEAAAGDDPMMAALRGQARGMLERDPRVLFHDELGDVYDPLYFKDVIAEARAHGLDYLADAEGVFWREELFPTPLGQTLRQLAGDDPVALQQQHDFFTGRVFRQTLLRRAGPLDRRVDPLRLRGLHVVAEALTGADAAAVDGPDEVRFTLGPGRAIEIGYPAVKRALVRIGQAYPAAVAIADLPMSGDVDEALLQLFTAGHVKLQVGPSPFAAVAGPRPTASPLARLQAEVAEGQITSLDHTPIGLEDPPARRFVALLDGTHDRASLAREMAAATGADAPVPLEQIESQLKTAARLGLLVREPAS